MSRYSFLADNIKKYLLRSFNYFIWAVILGLLTFFYWFTTGGSMFSAYLLNILGISVSLLIDKQRLGRIYRKLELCSTHDDRIKMSKKDVTSLKTSLYLFYIFALISSHVLQMDIGIEVTASVRGYFQVTGHGLILLFAIDTFFKHLMDDDKRVRMFLSECNDSK